MEANLAVQQAEFLRKQALLRRYFTPSAPVKHRDLFAGRHDQIARLLDAVAQQGQHAIIYGERGVGKTSLASLIHEFWRDIEKDLDMIPLRITCESADTFQSIWARIAEELVDLFERRTTPTIGKEAFVKATDSLQNGQAAPHNIRRFFERIGGDFIIIIDEFDRLIDDEETGIVNFADTIKILSDHSVPATLIIVGVADSVEQLIREHASVSRALVQVLMPPMSVEELEEIVTNGYSHVGVSIDKPTLRTIARASQGLPHYAHLLALHAADNALRDERAAVQRDDLGPAIMRAIDQAQENIVATYTLAVTSSRNNIFKQVLLACALTKVDSIGYFAARDVERPLSHIQGRSCKSPLFARHLREFASEGHGRVLQVTGERQKLRYRFAVPLLKPYIVLRGIREGLIMPSYLTSSDEPLRRRGQRVRK